MRNLIFCILLLASCQPLHKEEITGLWKLQQSLRDKMQGPDETTYLQILSNNSFSVSRTSGDMSGVYQLGETKIHFQAADRYGWFNSDWKADRVQDYLLLAGRDNENRRIELKFKLIEQIPKFDEFEKQVVGKWEMFLMMKDGLPEKMPKTFMEIDDSGSYTISDTSGIKDQGRSVINTRHHKVIFEKDETYWDVWFWGKELRLQNKELDVQYHLRR